MADIAEKIFAFFVFSVLGVLLIVGVAGWCFGMDDEAAPVKQAQVTWTDMFKAMISPPEKDETEEDHHWNDMRDLQAPELRKRGGAADSTSCFDSGGQVAKEPVPPPPAPAPPKKNGGVSVGKDVEGGGGAAPPQANASSADPPTASKKSSSGNAPPARKTKTPPAVGRRPTKSPSPTPSTSSSVKSTRSKSSKSGVELV